MAPVLERKPVGSGRQDDGPKHTIDIDACFRTQKHAVGRYCGQSTALFQTALAKYFAEVTPEACDFYHTIPLHDGQVHEGDWDLRDHEAAYLGHVAFDGRRVLEIGPGSGWLSSYIARCGGDLRVFELPLGSHPELVPQPALDMEAARKSGADSVRRLVNSWWYAKRELGFRAKAIYADIYEPPHDLAPVDIAVFGSILLHLSNPFRALERMARVTEDTMIVTDVLSEPILRIAGETAAAAQQPLALFNPTTAPAGLVHWWALSPEAVQHMLGLLGFPHSVVTFHSPPKTRTSPPLFTVVARRHA